MNQTKRETVLIVDDTPANLGVLFESLRQAGFKVLIAEESERAVKIVETFQPAIVLLDMALLDTDLCLLLKEKTDAPVIFLSVRTGMEYKLRALDTDAVDYTTEPFHLEEVVARVERHLELRNLQTRLEEKNVVLEREMRDICRLRMP